MSAGGGCRVDLAVHGLRLAFESSQPALCELVTHTYGPFQVPAGLPPDVLVSVRERSGALVLSDTATARDERLDGGATAARLATFNRLSTLIAQELAARGTYLVHAGAVVAGFPAGERALILSGPNGSGKTTLAVGLARRGWPLLSDEMAVVAPAEAMILPHHRAVHVRPGTPELVDGLDLLTGHPAMPWSDGSRWSLTTAELERRLSLPLGEPCPLGFVVILDRRGPRPRPAELEPIVPAEAAVALLRETPALAGRLPRTLARYAEVLQGVACARLAMGRFEDALDLIWAWVGRV